MQRFFQFLQFTQWKMGTQLSLNQKEMKSLIAEEERHSSSVTPLLVQVDFLDHLISHPMKNKFNLGS